MSMHVEGNAWDDGNDDRAADVGDGSEGRGPGLRLILLIVVVALAVVFVFQNNDDTTISFLVFDAEVGTWVGLFLAVALGVVLDRLFLWWWRRRRRRRA